MPFLLSEYHCVHANELIMSVINNPSTCRNENRKHFHSYISLHFPLISIILLFIAYAGLVKKVWVDSTTQAVVSPSELKRKVERFAPRFGGYK